MMVPSLAKDDTINSEFLSFFTKKSRKVDLFGKTGLSATGPEIGASFQASFLQQLALRYENATIRYRCTYGMVTGGAPRQTASCRVQSNFVSGDFSLWYV